LNSNAVVYATPILIGQRLIFASISYNLHDWCL